LIFFPEFGDLLRLFEETEAGNEGGARVEPVESNRYFVINIREIYFLLF